MAPHSDDDDADDPPNKRTKEDKKQPHCDDDDTVDSPDKRTKEDKKQHLIQWVSECTLKDIVLITNHIGFDSLGIRRRSELKGHMKMVFITANNIPIAQSHCCVGDNGRNTANEGNCSGYKHQIKAS